MNVRLVRRTVAVAIATCAVLAVRSAFAPAAAATTSQADTSHAAASRTADAPASLERHFADAYPPEVLASYPPRLRRVLEQRMRAERRRAHDQSDPLAVWTREQIEWASARLDVACAYWLDQQPR